MKLIGITGGIGAGKSTVSEYLIEKGYKVLDLDKIGAEAYKNIETIKKIEEVVGKGYTYTDVGKVYMDKHVLGRELFDNKDKLDKVTEIVLEYILKVVKNKLSTIEYTMQYKVFLDGATILENGWVEKLKLDEVWLVVAPYRVRQERVFVRDNRSKEEFNKIVNRQIPVENAKRQATHILYSEFDKEELFKQVDHLLEYEVKGNKRAVYAGSFNPMTIGHIDIIRRASKLFDEVIVLVGVNQSKPGSVESLEDRTKLVALSIVDAKLNNVKVVGYKGLTVDYMKKQGIKYSVRGIRDITDFGSERLLHKCNKEISSDMETVFLMSDGKNDMISSTFVRELIAYGKDISNYVMPSVLKYYNKDNN